MFIRSSDILPNGLNVTGLAAATNQGKFTLACTEQFIKTQKEPTSKIKENFA